MTEAETERRIVVFTRAALRDATIEALERLVQTMPRARVLVVRADAAKEPFGARVRTALSRCVREPVSRPLELLHDGFAATFAPRAGERPESNVALPTLDDLDNLWHVSFQSIRDPNCLDAIVKFQPWLGISIDAPPLDASLFGAPELGTIRVHASYLPEYRGGPAGFWELHDEAERTGVSVHWLDERQDAGEIVVQRSLKIPVFSTPAGLVAQLDGLATDLLTEAVTALDQETATRTTQLVPTTPARTKPPLLLRRRIERRCHKKRRDAQPGRTAAGEFAKRQAQRLFLASKKPRNLLRHARGEHQTAILCYNRVSDEHADSITVGVEQFSRHLEICKRHYDVLDLDRWLAERGRPRSRPAVLFTFDDGYEDNYLAAQLCRRAGVPCTFFICTGIVGTDSPFLHDLGRLGVRVPALSWEQCRTMAEWGFRFGNHTVFHTDCGQGDAKSILEEIETASRHLRNQLGGAARDRWFAFPFGRDENMTPDVRSGLERIGVEVTFGCQGGTNRQDFDLRNVRRIPISHRVSDIGLRAQIEGWKARAPRASDVSS